MNSTLGPAATEAILALADDEHLMGQQYAEWIGITPFLEEDLAFCSIGQDEMGHAALLYELLVPSTDAPGEAPHTPNAAGTDTDTEIDAIAFFRPPEEYRSCWLTEIPEEDWAAAVVRHWLYDRAELLRWRLFESSTVPGLGAVAQRVEREEVYHRRHADGLLDVLLDDDDAGPRLQAGLARWQPIAAGMFEPVVSESEAIAEGVQSGSVADLRPEWEAMVAERFGPGHWPTPTGQLGRTARSAEFGPLMTRMREVLDLDPTAIW